MPLPILALEAAARRKDLASAIAILLDELEQFGELGPREAVDSARARISRIVRSQASTWMQQPELVAADFYARTLDLPALAESRKRWAAELDARGPWLEPLRAVATRGEGLAELRSGPGFDLNRSCPRFVGDEEVVFDVRGPDGGPEHRVWNWMTGSVEQAPAPTESGGDGDYPRFSRGESAPLLHRSAGSEPIALPWASFGSADARLSLDGTKIYVYGWFEEYEGLLYVLDARTLEISSQREFSSSVLAVCDRPGSEELLVSSGGQIIIMREAGDWVLPAGGYRPAWSPSGHFICTVDTGVATIWDTRHRPTPTRQQRSGLPLCFSPDGSRLVDGVALLDGYSGASVASLDVHLGSYLEGGPATPWFHVGTEFIVCSHSGLDIWRTQTGEPVKPTGDLRAPHWERLGYDPSGTYYARARRGAAQIGLGRMPAATIDINVTFEVEVGLLALSDRGERIAVLGPGGIEVRRRDSTLEFRAEFDTGEAGGSAYYNHGLRFDRGGQVLEYNDASGAGRRWELEDGQVTAFTVGESVLPGWTVVSGPVSVFTHETGSTIVLAQRGPWLPHPRAPQLIACPGGLYQLRG